MFLCCEWVCSMLGGQHDVVVHEVIYFRCRECRPQHAGMINGIFIHRAVDCYSEPVTFFLYGLVPFINIVVAEHFVHVPGNF